MGRPIRESADTDIHLTRADILAEHEQIGPDTARHSLTHIN